MRELSSCLWIPEESFTEAVEESLTVSVYKLDGSTTMVPAFRTDREGFIGIPRVRGLKSISQNEYIDKRSKGKAVKFPRKVTLRDYQLPVVASIVDAARTRTDFIVEAMTGKGKTVMGLAAIQELGRSAAVLVDQENLLDQWITRCVEHLGMKAEDIGIVQGDTDTHKGKAITICMVQTLTRRNMPDSFYEAFGTIVFDESHSCGAPTFSRCLMMFPAYVRFGLSATPERRDGLQKILEWNLGTTDVRLVDQHFESSVYVMENPGIYSWRVNNSKMVGGFINEVVDDSIRNLAIARAVKWLYDSGRDVLVVSDRVEHVSALRALTGAVGVPLTDIGLYAKSRSVLIYEKDPRPLRKPPFLEKGAEYTPIRLAYVQKTIKKAELERVKETSRVIFATYGIIAKGVDIPRLSAGVDATPRSTSTQVHGRILRIMPGKVRPIWVTVADINSFRSLYQLSQRLRDYKSSNAEVYLWNIDKGRRKLDVRDYQADLADRIADLRRSQTVLSLDGNNALVPRR